MAEGEIVDFKDLLSIPAEDAVRPPPMPPGTYRCLIAQAEEVRSPEKQTPGIQFTQTNWEPMNDVDQDAWSAYANHPMIEVKKLTRTETFWLSRKSLWRLRKFCVTAGAEDSGPMGKLVADAKGNTILAKVVQTVGRGDSIYNEVQEYLPDERGIR